MNEVSLKIIDLKKNLNEKTRKISELDNKKGAIEGEIKKNIYDKNKFTDNKKIYFIVTGIHLLILATSIIGLTKIISSKFVVIVIVILYCFVAIILFITYNRNINRNKFKYHEFDIQIKNNNKCDYSPSLNREIENNEKIDQDDKNKVKSIIDNSK